jgi:hypothetical protein
MIKIVNDRTAERGQLLHYYFDGNEWYQKWEERIDLSKAAAAEQFQEFEATRQQVLAGELSPIAFHAQKRLFDVKLLSAYTGIPKRHIKKHFKPEHFSRLDKKTLTKYAEIFRISIEEINNV